MLLALWPWWRLKSNGDVVWASLTPEASWPVQGRWARQGEQLGSWRCGLGGV